MFKGLIVAVKEGQKVPVEFATKVLKEYPTYMGAAMVDPQSTEDAPEIWVEHFKEQEELTPANIDVIVENAGDKPCILFFANAPDQIAEQDYQPFSLLVNGEKVIAAIAMEGDFLAFEQAQSAISNEYHALDKYIMPKIVDLYDTLGNDEAKLIEKMKSSVFKHDLDNASAGRSGITILFCNGEVLQFGKNKDAAEFTWGAVSHTLGYKENVGEVHLKEAEAVVEAKPHRRSMLAAAKDVASNTASAVAAAVKPAAKPDTAIAAAMDKAKKTSDTSEAPKVLFLKCPPQISGKLNIRNWYRHRLGYDPQNSDQRPKVQVTDVNTIVKLMAEASKIQKSWADQGMFLPPIDRPVVGDAQPDENAARSGPQPNDKPVVTDPIPVLSPASKQAVETWMKSESVTKTFDQQGTAIPDPSSLPGWDVKGADFASIAKRKDLEEFLRLPYAALLELGRADVNALAKLCNDLKVHSYRQGTRINALIKQLPSNRKQQNVA